MEVPGGETPKSVFQFWNCITKQVIQGEFKIEDSEVCGIVEVFVSMYPKNMNTLSILLYVALRSIGIWSKGSTHCSMC